MLSYSTKDRKSSHKKKGGKETISCGCLFETRSKKEKKRHPTKKRNCGYFNAKKR